jgi:hypothetical protein
MCAVAGSGGAHQNDTDGLSRTIPTTTGSGGTELPRLRRFIDLPVVATVALTRLLLGAAAGWVFHDQLVGFSAAIAVGASGPAILQQLGAFQPVREAVQGPEPLVAGLVNESETAR